MLLALFPAIGCLVSLYAMIADPAAISRDLRLLSGFLPEGAVTVLGAELRRLAARPPAHLSLAFFAGLGVAVWSASGGFKALVAGLNVAFEVEEKRGFARLSLTALVFTLGGIAGAIAAIWLSGILPDWEQASPAMTTVEVLLWPAAFLPVAIIIALIYRFGPDRRRAEPRWISWGSAIAALLWMIGTGLFRWYVGHFGSYDRVYGDLGALVGFLTWVWLSLVVLLLGAEIDCARERGPSL